MSKLYFLGTVLCLGGLLTLLFQSISSLMNPGGMMWQSISIVSLLDPDDLNWIGALTVTRLKHILEYLVSAPLYALLLYTSGAFFILGGVSK